MANSNPHVGDTGTAIRLTVYDRGSVVDLSGFSTLEMLFKAPDGDLLTKTASLVNTGSDGQIEYVTQSSADLDVPGPWKVQARLVSNGGSWKTSSVAFTVEANLEA